MTSSTREIFETTIEKLNKEAMDLNLRIDLSKTRQLKEIEEGRPATPTPNHSPASSNEGDDDKEAKPTEIKTANINVAVEVEVKRSPRSDSSPRKNSPRSSLIKSPRAFFVKEGEPDTAVRKRSGSFSIVTVKKTDSPRERKNSEGKLDEKLYKTPGMSKGSNNE